MKCPTPCYLCGRIKELSALTFYTSYCRCNPFSSCTHGLCKTCDSAYSDVDKDDKDG